MARSKYTRSTRKATAAAPEGPATETLAPSPLQSRPVAVPDTEAPVTPAPVGLKRRRDDGDEGQTGEDVFYGRRSAKSRRKGVKRPETKDTEQKDRAGGEQAIATGPVVTPKGFRKRLKFDPEIHGVGLEARFLAFQQHDSFGDVVTPRKKIFKGIDKAKAKHSKASEHTSGDGLIQKATAPSLGNGDPVQQAGTSPSLKPVNCETWQDNVDEGTTADRSTVIPTPASLALEKRLRRLVSPAINNAQSPRPRTVGSTFGGSPAPVKSSKPLTRPSFELPGDAHMKKRAAERAERKKRMEEVEKQKEEEKKQQLQERFKAHQEKKPAKKDLQQGSAPLATQSSEIPSKMPAASTSLGPEALNSRRLTLDEVNQQLHNENEIEAREKAKEAVLRLRQEAAEKGKESARIWAEQMKAGTANF